MGADLNLNLTRGKLTDVGQICFLSSLPIQVSRTHKKTQGRIECSFLFFYFYFHFSFCWIRAVLHSSVQYDICCLNACGHPVIAVQRTHGSHELDKLKLSLVLPPVLYLDLHVLSQWHLREDKCQIAWHGVQRRCRAWSLGCMTDTRWASPQFCFRSIHPEGGRHPSPKNNPTKLHWAQPRQTSIDTQRRWRKQIQGLGLYLTTRRKDVACTYGHVCIEQLQ